MPRTLAPKRPELRNPHGLAKEHVDKLAAELGRLAEVDEEVAARTIRYVVDGTDEEVLLALGGLPKAATALRLAAATDHQKWNLWRQAAKERAKLLRPGTPAPAELWVRLGQVYEAAGRATRKTYVIPPGWPAWLAVFLTEAFQAWAQDDRSQKTRPRWTMDELEATLAAAGLPTDLLARQVLDRESSRLPGMVVPLDVWPIDGWAAYLARHESAVREALSQAGAEPRSHALRLLAQAAYDATPVVDLLVPFGVSSSKTVREDVLPLLMAARGAARPHVERALGEGGTAERNEAAALLWRLFGEELQETLRRHAEGETSDRVRQTIEKLLAAPVPTEETPAFDLTLPPVEVEAGVVPLPEEAKAAIRALFERAYQKGMQNYEKQLAQWQAPDRPKWMRKPDKPKPIAEERLAELFAFVEGSAKSISKEGERIPQYVWGESFDGDWLSPPGVKLIHVVRLSHAFGRLQTGDQYQGGVWWQDQRALEAYRRRCKPLFGLREMDAVVATLPHTKPGAVAAAYLAANNGWQTFCDWEPEAVWPAFVEHSDVLRALLGPSPNRPGDYKNRDYWWPQKRRNAFRVLAMFPQLPPEFIPLLWEVALGEGKSDRPLAQAALRTVPGKTGKIVVALGDGKQPIRQAAAEWLGQLGDPSVIEPLKAALRKEKQEAVKGAMLTALERMGADVGEFLDRDALADEAEEGLKKKRPKGTEWIPLETLPAVHWADSGERVDPRVVQWWVVQSVQQKSFVPGPLLRRYLAMCRREDAAALARFVLQAWVARDTSPLPHEEAAARAKKESDQMWAAYGRHQHFAQSYGGKKENLYQQLFQKYATEPTGSAIGEKGMLALVAAAGDRDCVRVCEQYLRKWFGMRMAQCKALVEVLAWIEHPMAVQVLLSVATRFRTKGIRQAAEEQVRALADRQGWTLDELADRTIPDAGFERPTDESGSPVGQEAVMTLDYGPRQFTVRLGDDLQPVITREDGKPLKAPPAPAKSDDAELAKAAKKAFSDAKKTVKDVVRQQTERLFEALCTQRAWRFEEWQRYLAWHPIVGRLCTRLVWAAFEPGESQDGDPVATGRWLGCFRPLEDGTLTNERDEEVTYPPETHVRLAHTANTPAEVGAAWEQHLKDYDVEPLFAQFGRPTYTLPEGKDEETDVADFRGHVLTTFKLRSKATKLGWIRGEAEDAGVFHVYRKPFPSLQLAAVLEFTGSFLPEEDITAALRELYFERVNPQRQAGYSWQPDKLPLRKVPAVLLSECYNDVRQIAAEGSGFDAEWEKKSYF